MITVPEAARIAGKNPETIRRWIRAGRLRSTKMGTQHMIDELDLDAVVGGPATELPEDWRGTPFGEMALRAVAMVRELRDA